MRRDIRKWFLWVLVIGILVGAAYVLSDGAIFRGEAAELWPD